MYKPNIIPKKINISEDVSVLPCKRVGADTYRERLVANQEANTDTINGINKMKSLIIKDNSFEISNYGRFKKSLTNIILNEKIISEDESLSIDKDTLLPLIFDSITIDDSESSDVKVNKLIGFTTKDELYSVRFSNLLKVTYLDIPQLINNVIVFSTSVYDATNNGKLDVLHIIACLISATAEILTGITEELDGKKFIPVLKVILTYPSAFSGVKSQLITEELIKNGMEFEEIETVLSKMCKANIIGLSGDNINNENTILTLKEKVTFL